MEVSDQIAHVPSSAGSDLTLQKVGYVKSGIKVPFLKFGEDSIEMQEQTNEAVAEYQETRHQLSQIIIHADWMETIDGIEAYSHLIVFYWAHKIPRHGRSLHLVHPMGRKVFPKVGVYSTFSPARPNPLLMTVVRLHRRKENILEVTGLDAVDGSPVIDIKPYVKEFFPRKFIVIPTWMQSILNKIVPAVL